MDPVTSTPLASAALLGIDPTAMTRNSKPSKLHKAAQDFEALMIGEMLKSTREAGSDGWLGSGDSDGNDSAMQLAESQLSLALARGGGLGLGSLIEKQLSRSEDQNSKTSSGDLSAGSAK